MTAPILFNTMVLLAKPEVTLNTDPTLTGALNAILATNVALQPMEGEDISRDLIRAYLGGQETIPNALRCTLSFDTELAGSGAAGTAPAWGPLARMCALSETISVGVSVTYARVSAAMESGYFKFWFGGTLHAFKGARGSAEITLDANAIPKIRWTFTGLWVAPSDTAAVTPTLTAFVRPLIVNKTNTPTFTINSVAMVLRSYKLNLGNKVEYRGLVGREEMIIVDYAESLDCKVEAVPLATLNPFSLANAMTKVPVAVVHGTAAGNIVTINTPTAQVKRPSGFENNQNTVEWPLGFMPVPNAGNDAVSMVLT